MSDIDPQDEARGSGPTLTHSQSVKRLEEVFARMEELGEADELSPGDRVVSSGDGGLYPPDLLIGQIFVAADGRQRVRLAADNRRLEFVRVLRDLARQFQFDAMKEIIRKMRDAAR